MADDFKAPEPTKTEMRELEHAMTSMVSLMSRMYKNQVLLELNKGTIDKFADAQTGNYANVLTSLSRKASKGLTSRFSNKRIKNLVTKILSKSDSRARKLFYQSVAKQMGVDPSSLLKKDGMTYDFNALVIETTRWATKLRDETLELYTANTLRAMTLGESLESILEQYDGMVEKRKNHAEFTARNQISNFNSIMNKTRAQKLGIKKAVWLTSRDERVRHSHEVRHGKEFDLDKGLYSSTDGKWLLPGTDYQCFQGGLKIDHTSFVRKMFRRHYTGKLSTIITDDGRSISSTANHPVLTTAGFKPAHLISSGDYIVKTIDKTFDVIELYGKDVIPTFEQVFSSLDLLGVEHTISTPVAGEFHGDVSDSEIDIVSVNGLLTDELNSSVIEKFRKLNLSNSDEMIVFKFFTCLGDGFSSFDASGFSSGRVVSVLDLVRSRFIAHLTPLERLCFTLGSWFNSGIEKPVSDCGPTDIEVFSDCIFAFSVLVHGNYIFDRKIDAFKSGRLGLGEGKSKLLGAFAKNGWMYRDGSSSVFGGGQSIHYEICRVNDNVIRDFSGHVYNLETISNDYIVEATTVSNCRCSYRMIIEDDENGES